MSQMEDLLNSISEDDEYTEMLPTPDDSDDGGIGPIDDMIEIDAEGRFINLPDTELIFGIETDNNVERKYFKCPKKVGDNVDLSTMSLRVHYINAAGEKDAYFVNDKKIVDEYGKVDDNGKYIKFSWLLSRKVLATHGTVKFAICALKTTINSGTSLEEVSLEWNTSLGMGTVGEGIDFEGEESYEDTPVYEALDSLLAMIESTGTIQKNVVEGEGNYWAGRVGEVGVEQVEAINEAADELLILPDKVAKNEVDIRTKARAIVGSAEGSTIVLNDASDDYIRQLKIFGRTDQVKTTGANLAESYIIGDGVDQYNTVLWVEADLQPSTTYTISFYGTVGNNIYINEELTTMKVIKVASGLNTLTFTTVDDLTSSNVYQYSSGKGWVIFKNNSVNSANKFDDLMLNVGDTALPYEPYSGGVASPSPSWSQEIASVGQKNEYVAVKVYGENLLPTEYSFTSPKEVSGVTFVDNGDGSITVSGTPTAYAGVQLTSQFYLESDVSICLLGKFDNVLCEVNVYDSNDVHLTGFVGSKSVTLLKTNYPEGSRAAIAIKRSKDNSPVSGTIYPMIVAGTTMPTEYKPYIKHQTLMYEPNDNNGLMGIPVTSGGNYTDENGQQWVCDEMDLARGKYIQRVYLETLAFTPQTELNRYSATVTHTANTACADGNGIPVICDTLPFDPNCGSGTPMINGIRVATTSPKYAIAYYNGEVIESAVVAYPLAEPIEHDLFIYGSIDIDTTSFKDAHTLYPYTTIVNDSGAHMVVEYNRDQRGGLYLKDVNTGVEYLIQVVDGKLTMKEA